MGRPGPLGLDADGIVPGKDTGLRTRVQVFSPARFAGQELAGDAAAEAGEIIDVEQWKKLLTEGLGLDEKRIAMVTDVTASQKGVEEHVKGLATSLGAKIEEATGIDGAASGWPTAAPGSVYEGPMTDLTWKSGDKAWKAERTRQWRVVEANLKLLARSTGLKRGAFKLHKELFFEGTVGGKSLEALRSGGDPFLFMLPTFWLWYHPDPANVDLDALRDTSLAHTRLRNATRRLFGDWSEAGAIPPDLLPPEYGLMGGRERLAVALLCPGLDCHESIMDPRGKSHPACLNADSTYHVCLDHSTRELRTDATFYPYAPGQFLWPQLVFAMEHYPDEALVEDQNGSTETKRHELKRVVAEVLGFEQRQDASRSRPSTVAFVQRVLAAQAAGFTGEMAALWREAADEKELLVRDSAELGKFHMSGAQIDEWYDVQWSDEERQARVDRWESG